MSDNIDVVRTFYDGLAAGDLAVAFSRFDRMIDWREAEGSPYAAGNPYTTPAAVMSGVLARTRRDWDGYEVAIERFIADGEWVVALGRCSGTHRRTGKRMRIPVAHAWIVRDGLIIAFRQFVDTALIQQSTAWSLSSPVGWPTLDEYAA